MLTSAVFAVLIAAVWWDDPAGERSRQAGVLACGVAAVLIAAGVGSGWLAFAGAFCIRGRERALKKLRRTPLAAASAVSMISRTRESDMRP